VPTRRLGGSREEQTTWNGGSLRAGRKVVPEDARRHNRALALRSLFRAGPLSRADLARVTHLTPPSASDLVAELLEDGLVEELGRRADQGVGKPATLVGIVPDARHIVCLDLGDAREFHGARINLMGKVLDRRTIDREGRTGAAATDLAVQLAVSLAADAERPLLGVGIGSPGLVHPDGVVLEAANLRWHGEDLASATSARLDLPVHVANDANAAALAEYTFGEAHAQSLLMVKIGEGVGAGLLIDGQLFVGGRFSAGEIGHVMVDGRGEVCACGRRGCLETAIAAPVVRRRLAGQDARGQQRVLQAAGRRLGVALATVVSALNLDEVVLSGPPDVVGEPFRRAALATIRRRMMPALGEHVQLRASSLGEDDVLLGAAVLVLSQELGVA
jgi:predicted NBD/HSP70 family sugar kinase